LLVSSLALGEKRHVLTLLLQDRWLVGLSHLLHKLEKFWNPADINMSGFFRHLRHTSFFDILRRTICLSCIMAYLGFVRFPLHDCTPLSYTMAQPLQEKGIKTRRLLRRLTLEAHAASERSLLTW
jgi:hypothetical protein